MTFFSHQLQIPPSLPVSVHFPYFVEIIISPYFQKCPPVFVVYVFFYILYMHFFSPYFDYDTFMHHTIHVLDAPGFAIYIQAYLLFPMGNIGAQDIDKIDKGSKQCRVISASTLKGAYARCYSIIVSGVTRVQMKPGQLPKAKL